MRARRAARLARASAARAAFVLRRRIAIPATTSSWAVLDAAGRSAGSSSASAALGFVDAPDQQQAPDLEIPRVRGVRPVGVRFERRPRRVERLRRPAEVARDERDLGLGDDAPRAGHGLFRTEGTRSTSQESLRSNEIAELRHRNASKRERRRVVAQGDPLQRAEGIARRQCTRRGSDQRVHRNPVTFVTPTLIVTPALSASHKDRSSIARAANGRVNLLLASIERGTAVKRTMKALSSAKLMVRRNRAKSQVKAWHSG